MRNPYRLHIVLKIKDKICPFSMEGDFHFGFPDDPEFPLYLLEAHLVRANEPGPRGQRGRKKAGPPKKLQQR